jgi:hypothetical protein
VLPFKLNLHAAMRRNSPSSLEAESNLLLDKESGHFGGLWLFLPACTLNHPGFGLCGLVIGHQSHGTVVIHNETTAHILI